MPTPREDVTKMSRVAIVTESVNETETVLETATETELETATETESESTDQEIPPGVTMTTAEDLTVIHPKEIQSLMNHPHLQQKLSQQLPRQQRLKLKRNASSVRSGNAWKPGRRRRPRKQLQKLARRLIQRQRGHHRLQIPVNHPP